MSDKGNQSIVRWEEPAERVCYGYLPGDDEPAYTCEQDSEDLIWRAEGPGGVVLGWGELADVQSYCQQHATKPHEPHCDSCGVPMPGTDEELAELTTNGRLCEDCEEAGPCEISTCGDCPDISRESQSLWAGRYCAHDLCPAPQDGAPEISDDHLSGIPDERLDALTGAVRPGEAPPWWCPRRIT
jgi:hypothetical protein